MLVYYCAYATFIFAGIFCLKGRKTDFRQSSRRYCITFAVIGTLLLGLRHPSMGVDLVYGSSGGYLGRFEYIANLSWKEALTSSVLNYERGYIIFNKILGLFGDDSQILLFACALVCIGLVSVWIFKNSDYPTLSTIIYLGLPCFLINYSGLRQALGIAITTLSFEMIKKRKVVWFGALVLLACTFHSSAWIFLFAYPIYHFKMGKTLSFATIFVPPVAYVFRYPLFSILSKLFKPNAIPDHNNSIALFLVFWAVYVFAVLFGYEQDSEELGLRNLFLVACICQAMGGVYNTAIRVGYYFMMSLVILLPKLIKNNTQTLQWERKDNSALIMYLVIFVCFAAFGLYSIANGSWAMSNPYSFYWQ